MSGTVSKPIYWGIDALRASREERRHLQEEHAAKRDRWIHANRYYYDSIKRLLRYIIEPGRSVLEIRCQTGHLLNAVKPSRGVGVEISKTIVELARKNFPALHFFSADPEDLDLDEQFDYVLLSYLFDTVDILGTLERVKGVSKAETRVVVHAYNHLWQPVLEIASKLGLGSPVIEPNWLTEQDIYGFLELAGFEVLRTHRIVLLPKWVPFLSWFCNEVLAALPGLRKLCLVKMIVARPKPVPKPAADVSVSVIIPCRNERDNVAPAVSRIPDMGKHTEIIFCDDASTDGTAAEIESMIRENPHRDIQLVHGPAICKADNVWAGFRAARGDLLMILDGDLTVMPEELPYFFNAIVSGAGEFINGSRLVYPIPQHAMNAANMAGNKAFSWVFSYLLDQRLKDTLCGTKVLWRKDWLRIERFLGSWGMKDLWGDYELLLGASRLHLCIRDVPVHYQERIYGITKMTRVFANGMRMLRICVEAGRRLHG
jgi:SAM-dependent methyltransferase